jgi:hypothetical protein
MLRVLRITLMWLLALAIPVQGFAAVSMLGCGTGHHGAAGGHSHALGMHQHAVDTPQHSHGVDSDEMAHASHHQPAGSHGDAHKPDAGASSKASCSACAACCTSAALPATPVVFEATHGPDTFGLLAPLRVASFISGGLERPPKSFLA